MSVWSISRLLGSGVPLLKDVLFCNMFQIKLNSEYLGGELKDLFKSLFMAKPSTFLLCHQRSWYFARDAQDNGLHDNAL